MCSLGRDCNYITLNQADHILVSEDVVVRKDYSRDNNCRLLGKNIKGTL